MAAQIKFGGPHGARVMIPEGAQMPEPEDKESSPELLRPRSELAEYRSMLLAAKEPRNGRLALANVRDVNQSTRLLNASWTRDRTAVRPNESHSDGGLAMAKQKLLDDDQSTSRLNTSWTRAELEALGFTPPRVPRNYTENC